MVILPVIFRIKFIVSRPEISLECFKLKTSNFVHWFFGLTNSPSSWHGEGHVSSVNFEK